MRDKVIPESKYKYEHINGSILLQSTKSFIMYLFII
jgi:hypothetical protein